MIGGGSFNVANGTRATVGGGSGNIASDFDTTVSGGAGNTASGTHATVGGGLGNEATGIYATVGGGYGNSATGDYATVPGGSDNLVAGDFGFATGQRAQIAGSHDGTFLFADASPSDFHSAEANEFAVRATGGVRFVTALDEAGQPLAGVRLAPRVADRGRRSVLGKPRRTSCLWMVSKYWRSWPQCLFQRGTMSARIRSVRHLGPMAQEFRSAFGLGEDDQHIDTVDADGVALAALQGVHRLLEEKDAQIASQQRQILSLEARVEALEATNNSLEPKPGAKAKFSLVPWLLGSGPLIVVGRFLPSIRRS